MKAISRTALAVAAVFVLGGCQQALDQLARDLDAINANHPGAQKPAAGARTAVMADAVRNYKTQVSIPNDSRVSSAFDEALPVIKKVLGIHQCISKAVDSAPGDVHLAPLRQLNQYAMPGFDASKQLGWVRDYVPMYSMQYHNSATCLAVQTIDSVTMPAANAMSLRTVYMSTESQEIVNFRYVYQKWSDGSWRLREFGRTN